MTETNQEILLLILLIHRLKRKREEDQKQNGDTMKMAHIIHNL